MKKKIFLFSTIILVITLAVVISIFKYLEYQHQHGPIVIGATTDMATEDDYGRSIRRAIEFRVKQVNEAGGVNGRQLELIWGDTDCEYEGGLEVGDYLVNKENVHIIIGGVCEDSAKAISKFTIPHKVIFISPGASSPSLAAENDYFYRTYPSGIAQGKLLVSYLNNKKVYKVGELISTNEYTEGISGILQESYGGIYNREIVEYETTDFITQLENLREHNPDILFMNVDFIEEFATILEQMTAIDWCPPILGDEMFVIDVGENYLPELQAYKECMGAGEIAGLAFAIDEEAPKFIKLEEEFMEWSGGIPFTYKTYAATAIDAVDILVEALGYVKNEHDHDALKEALDVIQYIGYSGPITFTKTGDVRSGYYYLYRFNGAEFVKIEK